MAIYRAGIVGCGGIGRIHAAAYLSTDGVEVAACSDINPTNLNAFSERYHITRKYLDYVEMLEAGGLDVVSVCTWPKRYRLSRCEPTNKASEFHRALFAYVLIMFKMIGRLILQKLPLVQGEP